MLPLARKISSAIGRTDYVRVAIDEGRAYPLATSGASILSSTVRAQGAVIVARGHEGMAEGEEVEILLYDEEPAPSLPGLFSPGPTSPGPTSPGTGATKPGGSVPPDSGAKG
tara:strand:- start:247 stop:582 length:336 start_codon:yes stop_codon:yes gene_type:complete